ncbi:MAG TPA: SRPBCC family protein [Noviherbaspirillum sp.]|uniref:SRPBCC family protein n=1 Tax=Noviherbaspirillum sp. TaxID=1926288 RepID=UPI002B484F85|nr:SRPBCC family protein [Noviherbaspirillum sp.]HJV87646.1 SRPBCC family protein [Noviherbaspirillum sp.]
MKFRALWQFTALGICVLAHGIAASAPLLDVRESIALSVAPGTAWQAVKDFDNMAWHPAVATTQLTAGRNNERQAVRLLTLKDGATMREQLREYDDARRAQHYAMLDSPLPVTDYEASLAVTQGEGGGAVVTWQARFRRKEGAAMDDTAVRSTISGIFAAGLGNLKQLLQGQR